MKMRSLVWLAVGLLPAAGGAHAATVSVSNGFYAGSFVRDCRSDASLAGPDKCIEGDLPTFFGTFVELKEVAYPGATTASSFTTNALARSSASDVTGGRIEAAGDGSASPPLIRQAAFTSTNYARVSSGVVSVQGWSWDGTGDARRTMNVATGLSGSNVVDSFTSGFDPESVFSGAILVFALDSRTFEVEDGLGSWDPVRNPDAACSFNFSLRQCLGSKRADYLEIALGLFNGTAPDTSISFELDPGLFYFTYLQSQTLARFGAYLDARNTVVATWEDETGIAVVPGTTVPEPGTLALLGLGLAGLGLTRRRMAG